MKFPKETIVRLKGTKLKRLYKHVLERDCRTCQECGSGYNLEIHHIRLRSQGGSDTMGNLVVLCRICHAKKHGIKVV